MIEYLGGFRPEEDLGLVPDGASCRQHGQCLGGECVGEKLTTSLNLAKQIALLCLLVLVF